MDERMKRLARTIAMSSACLLALPACGTPPSSSPASPTSQATTTLPLERLFTIVRTDANCWRLTGPGTESKPNACLPELSASVPLSVLSVNSKFSTAMLVFVVKAGYKLEHVVVDGPYLLDDVGDGLYMIQIGGRAGFPSAILASAGGTIECTIEDPEPVCTRS